MTKIFHRLPRIQRPLPALSPEAAQEYAQVLAAGGLSVVDWYLMETEELGIHTTDAEMLARLHISGHLFEAMGRVRDIPDAVAREIAARIEAATSLSRERAFGAMAAMPLPWPDHQYLTYAEAVQKYVPAEERQFWSTLDDAIQAKLVLYRAHLIDQALDDVGGYDRENGALVLNDLRASLTPDQIAQCEKVVDEYLRHTTTYYSGAPFRNPSASHDQDATLPADEEPNGPSR